MTTTSTIERTHTRPTDRYPSRDERPARILARDDAVVRPGMSGPLSGHDVAVYARDGYLIVPGVFSGDEVAAMERAVDTRIDEELRRDVGDGRRSTGRIVHEPGSGAVRSMFGFHERSDELGRIATDHRLVSVARQLLGSDVVIHQSRVNRKPGLRGRDFPWHSDFETWHTEDGMPAMRALSATVWLTDNHAWNGSLLVMPGSHRWFVTCPEPTPSANHETSLREQRVGVPGDDELAAMFDDHGLVPCTGQAGSVLFFDCNLLHGSPSNLSPLPRHNLFVVYNSVENRLQAPFGAASPRPAHLADRRHRMVRPG